MEDLLNIFAGRAAQLDGRVGQSRWATVADVDPATHRCKVNLQPGGQLSGWIPVPAIAVSASMKISCLPHPGDQVFVSVQEGDAQHPVIVGRYNSEQAPPPISPFTGQPGGVDDLLITGPNGAALHLSSDGVWRIAGDVRVDGEIYDRHGSLDRLRQHYDAHVHDGVERGGSSTDTTSAPDAE